MATQDYEFLQVLSRFRLDEETRSFFAFVHEQLKKTPGTLNPVACLVFCAWRGRLPEQDIPEFTLVADHSRAIDFKSFHEFALKALTPTHISNAAMMTDNMVAVLEDGQQMSQGSLSYEGKEIYPRHFLGALLHHLMRFASQEEHSFLRNLGLEIEALIESFLAHNIEAQNYSDNPKEFDLLLQPFRIGVKRRNGLGARELGLADAENTLLFQIEELQRRRAAISDTEEQVQIDNAIQELSTRLKAVQSERGTRLPRGKLNETQTADSIQNALSKWNFSSSCIDLLTDVDSRRKYFQIQSPSRIISLTPEIVLLMLLIKGCSHKGNPDYLAAVIAKAFSLTEKYLEQALAETFSESLNAAELSSSIISPRLEEVFDFADKIARKVSAKVRISQRHLIAALLYGNANSQISKSGIELPASIFRPNEFVWELEKYVNSSPTVRSKELPHEWEHVIAEIRHRNSFPEGSVLLASEIRALEKKGGNTTDQAERVQIKAELDQKHAELNASLAPRSNGVNLKAWDAEFAALRRDAGFRWSTTLDRVLDLLWEEHSRAFNESLGAEGRFEPQISPRALFLAALLHGARHQDDLRDRADDRGQTLIHLLRACELNEKQTYRLLNQEFFRPMPPDRVSQDRAVVSTELEAVIKRADEIRKTFGSDPYIGTRHLILALLEAPEGGKTGDLIFRDGDGFDKQRLISAFRDSVTDKLWVKKYDTAATWPTELEKLEQSLLPKTPDGGKDFDFLKRCEARFRELKGKWNFSSPMISVLEQLRLALERSWAKGDDRLVTPIALTYALLIHGSNDGAWPEDLFGFLYGKFPGGREALTNRMTDELARNQPSARGNPKIFGDTLTPILENAQRLAEHISSDKIIGARHILAAILQDQPTVELMSQADLPAGDFLEGLTRHVEGSQIVAKIDRVGAWESALGQITANISKLGRKPDPIHFGSKDDWDRNAAETEAGLNVDDYTAALRDVYTKAGAGEFSLAVFGHWGRGKTFLMNRLAKLLKTDNYETVFFSAWKYPTTPEVWVHLYETVADKVCSGWSLAVLPRIIRTGIARHGPWPILAALSGLAFSLTPKLQLAKLVGEALVGLSRIAGLGGLIWLTFLAMGVRRTKAKLTHNYITATRHTDKLGLQATIGRDLKALLKGWMPVGREVAWIPWICYLIITIWISWSAWAWFGLSIGQKSDFSWLHYVAPIIALLVMGLLACWAIIPINKPSRLLLVIDDLDRCNTGQLLHVIESVKLLTEEPDVSKRLQVAALVDEDILEHAVLWKHKDLQKGHCSKKFSARRIIRENCEKLFTAHLRLPGLDHEELGEIFDLVMTTDKEAKRVESAKTAKGLQDAMAVVPSPIDTTIAIADSDPSESSKGLLGRAFPGTNTARDNKGEVIAEVQKVKEAKQRLESVNAQVNSGKFPAQVNDQAKPAEKESLLKVDFRFGENETEEIAQTIKRLSSGSSSGPWGPRSVRAFVFRYQLARMLANSLCGDDWTPKRICELFVELAKPLDQQGIIQADAKLAKVVRQVA